MCLVCFTVVGTIAVGSQLTPMPASETSQPPEQEFSTSQIYSEGAPSFTSSYGNLLSPVRNSLASRISDPVDQCRIQEASKNRANYGDKNYTQAGFPVSRLTANSGVVKWALIPIEFRDQKGEKKFRSRVNSQMKLLSDWFSTVSGGRLTIEWVVAKDWVTLPGKASDYSVARSVNLGDDPEGLRLFRDAMTEADPSFDFTGIQTVNFILPKGQKAVLETVQGFPWDEAVKNLKTDEGSIASFSIAGHYFDQPQRTYWSYWAHEFGHAIALPHIGLSRGSLPPFNPWDLMGGQDGPSRELSGWLRMLAGWLSDSQIYCKEANSIERQNLNLVPLSSSKKGVKLAVIRISETKALLLESRRETKFSCKTQPGRNGVLVYVLDAKLGHGEDFLKPIIPQGRSDAYSNCNTAPHRDALLRAGNKVSFEGLTVEVLSQGSNDRVRITSSR
jgi:M6 family metalloprotease-like protein